MTTNQRFVVTATLFCFSAIYYILSTFFTYLVVVVFLVLIISHEWLLIVMIIIITFEMMKAYLVSCNMTQCHIQSLMQ
jgi:hypothetical protein